MKRKPSKYDYGLFLLLFLVYIPLSVWGGSEEWAGATDMLPFIMLGFGMVIIIIESIRLCSPGLVPVLAAMVPVLTIAPSLFLCTTDAEALPILVASAYLFGLLTSSICWAISVRTKSGIADWAMWLGLHSLFFTVLSIPAVICGHIALSNRKHDQGISHTRAISGLITGYVVLAIFIVGLTIIAANA
jgi:hypothetical protein